jgi:hypothetical protein
MPSLLRWSKYIRSLTLRAARFPRSRVGLGKVRARLERPRKKGRRNAKKHGTDGTQTALRGTQTASRTVRERAAPLEPLANFSGDLRVFEEAHVELLEPLAKLPRFLRFCVAATRKYIAPLWKN